MERLPESILTTLALSLLALTLISPWALGQDPDPITEIRLAAEQDDAEAQYAASLFQAQSIRCELGQGTTVSWDRGRPSFEQSSLGWRWSSIPSIRRQARLASSGMLQLPTSAWW